MENKNLKNILVAAGLAVFAGVLTLGVNAAFGSVDAPTQNPADASLHSPRFNNVEVEGYLQNNTANVDPSINPPVVINDALSVYAGLTSNADISANANVIVTGDVKVAGSIKNPKAQSATFGAITVSSPPITVEGDLKITDIEAGVVDTPAGNLEVNGKIFNLKKTAGGANLPVSILDNLDVSNDLTVAGAATANRFGTYIKEKSAKSAAHPNQSVQVTIACPANSYLVSCQPRAGETLNNYNDWTSYVYVNHANADIDTNTCKVRAKNVHPTFDRYVWAEAICLNPEI